MIVLFQKQIKRVRMSQESLSFSQLFRSFFDDRFQQKEFFLRLKKIPRFFLSRVFKIFNFLFSFLCFEKKMKVFFVVVGLVFCVVGLVSSIPVSMMLSLNQVKFCFLFFLFFSFYFFLSFESFFENLFLFSFQSSNGGLNDPDKLQSDLYQLKSGGVDGIMSDVWWGSFFFLFFFLKLISF